MTIIYGVDTDKPISPIDVRNAIVECFTQAHSEALSDLKNYDKNIDDITFEKVKRINIEQMIRNYFAEAGDDFDHPDKNSILKVMDKLKNFALNFRDQSIVEKHYGEIKTLVDRL